MTQRLNNDNTARGGHYAQPALTDAELEKIIALIYQRAGIVITRQRRDMVYNRLAPRLRALGLAHFSAYLQLLDTHPAHAEWQLFINALTTNLTSFFREAYHFPLLAAHARQRGGGYSVWCAAASTGEEPWSIAITLDEALGAPTLAPRVLATDIDTEVLEIARRGTYRLADLQPLTPQQKRTYFLRGRAGGQQTQVKVGRALRHAVRFEQLNLVAPEWPIPAPFDAIFCRNVMIYFDQPTQLRLLNRFATRLKPGGLLFVGHSEQFSHLASPFRLKGQSVYCLAKEEV